MVFIIVFVHGRWFTFVANQHTYQNHTGYIETGTLRTVDLSHLWFCLTAVEVLANFLTHKYGLDYLWYMELKT